MDRPRERSGEPSLMLPCSDSDSCGAGRAIRPRGVKCGTTRVPLTRFTRSWDRAILAGINTWMDLGSDPVSSL